ncbi:MAG: murein L,D-transpeptidase [Clostridia bacterium]|nr:murein L,D-transpeptidase [Clostridia bacterium]
MKKRLLAALLAAMLLLSACSYIVVDDAEETVLSAIMGAAHGETAAEYTDTEIQQRLIELGFLTGYADGIFGPRSVAALTAFQEFCGFDATGEKDENTLAMLFGDPAALPTPSPTPIAKGARDDEQNIDIVKLQERLKELNYLSGKADGIFGKGTENALMSFQELNGLEITGVADEATLRALHSALASPMPTPEPTPRARGAKGDEIKQIQEALQIMGFMGGNADGDFGPETENSVKRYQQYIHDAEIAYYEANPTPTPTPTSTPEPTEEPTPTPEPTASPAPTAGITLITPEPEEGEDTEDIIGDATIEPTEEPTPEPTWEPDGIVTDELMADILAYEGVTLYVEDLQRGSKSDEVVRLQRRLASLWYLGNNWDIDGQFGPNTESAIKYFQKRNNMEETGIADEDVQLLLFSAEAVKSDRPVHMYKLRISVDDQKVYAYKWVNGAYSQLERTMICSTGTYSDPTPLGTFSAGGPCGRWYYFKKFDCWAQYAYRIDGPILFHSVIYSEKDESTLRQSSVNNLGSRASHGCIRLKVEDAKWIYNNCPAGTTVDVY